MPPIKNKIEQITETAANIEQKVYSATHVHVSYIICIVIVLGLMIFLWQSNVSKQKEIENLNARISVQQTIEQLDSQLKDMEQRRAELYPELSKKQVELDNTLSQLEKQRKELDNVKKDKIAAKINKMDLKDLNNELNNLGYASSITGGK